MAVLTSAFTHGSSIDSTISYVRVDGTGNGIITFAKALTNPAECSHNSWQSSLSFDVKTEAGRAIYSLALTAYASNKALVAGGTSTCDQYDKVVESWGSGYIH